MAASVTLLTAGLLWYAPSTSGEWQAPETDLIGGYPLLTEPPDVTPLPHLSNYPSSVPSKSPPSAPTSPGVETPTATPPTETPPPTDPALGTPTATRKPVGSVSFASRIRIPSLGIDLPVVPGDLVVRGNRNHYPLCDVAMYMPNYVQPGRPGATYIYAHAQRGMFAPLLKASKLNDGASLLGALIEIYTTDNQLHLYELHVVKRHATDLSLAHPRPGKHIVVLQTSEGPTGTVPKLQVAARPLSVVPANPAEANPRPRPRVCLPG